MWESSQCEAWSAERVAMIYVHSDNTRVRVRHSGALELYSSGAQGYAMNGVGSACACARATTHCQRATRRHGVKRIEQLRNHRRVSGIHRPQLGVGGTPRELCSCSRLRDTTGKGAASHDG